MEEDHLDYFKDILQIRDSFHKFASLLPSDGCLIINGDIDHWVVARQVSVELNTTIWSCICLEYCVDV